MSDGVRYTFAMALAALMTVVVGTAEKQPALAPSAAEGGSRSEAMAARMGMQWAAGRADPRGVRSAPAAAAAETLPSPHS